MRRLPLYPLLLLIASVLTAAETDVLLARAWPQARKAGLGELGTGVAVVFSPDLSVPGNCRFYQALGFACFDDADWTRVLAGIHAHNLIHPHRTIRTVILETHGTNGNGLKLQRSSHPSADRSYISVGALQEWLECYGVRYAILSACNSGRLLRSSIYRTLDPDPGDRLFLPPTCGILSASAGWNPRRSRVRVITPASSHIEMTVVGSVGELAPRTRRLILESAAASGTGPPDQFAISDLMMQMILRDPRLKLRLGGGQDLFSRQTSPDELSESLFAALIRRLNALARAKASPAAGRPRR